MAKELVPSTQAISKFHPKDEWIVVINKEEFVLNGKQTELLKKASQANLRGLIWFDKFAISIPHIQSVQRSKSGLLEEKARNNPLIKKLRERNDIE